MERDAITHNQAQATGATTGGFRAATDFRVITRRAGPQALSTRFSAAIFVALFNLVLVTSLSEAVAQTTFVGTIKYDGAFGPVSPTRPIRVCSSIGWGDNPFVFGEGYHATITSNAGAFAVQDYAVSGDTPVLLFFLDLNYDPTGYPCGVDAPKIGDPYLLSVGQSGTFTFDDTSRFPGLAGTVTYTGKLGPVSPAKVLYLQAFGDRALTQYISDAGYAGRLTPDPSTGVFSVATLTTDAYYLKAFLDLNGNYQSDPGEPFTIYQNKSQPPADPVFPGLDQTNLHISFGDEDVPSSPTPTPTPGFRCVGDCDGGESVTVNEIITLVNIALGSTQPSACPDGIPAGAEVNVALILQAVNHALNGCGGG